MIQFNKITIIAYITKGIALVVEVYGYGVPIEWGCVDVEWGIAKLL